ncbi:TPA: hypothetical protein ACTW0P_000544 [Klebsiella pneumoniae]|uniref:hypothetical protein n=2 Tax=Citrobacter freundii TaxID=546 RepID=UPI000A3C7FC0|nr:hypothetical protein [Citrobacter freundii]OUE67222.1 hypothetical protein AZ007_000277 [Citrobacter freundii]
MGLFDLFIKKNNNNGNKKVDYNGRMRLDDAEVDIMFIVKNDKIMYINNYTDELYTVDADNDMKLDGRVVNFIFKSGNEVIEIFIAFDDQDSYMMFTVGVGRDERLNYVAPEIFKFMAKNNINNVFSPTAKYSTQYYYTFNLYKKNNKHFMINNGQTQAYLFEGDVYKNKDVGAIISEFWERDINV